MNALTRPFVAFLVWFAVLALPARADSTFTAQTGRTVLTVSPVVAQGIVAPDLAPYRVGVRNRDKLTLVFELPSQGPAINPASLVWLWTSPGGRSEVIGTGASVNIDARRSFTGRVTVQGVPSFYAVAPIEIQVDEPGHIGNLSSRTFLMGKKPVIVGYIVTGATPKEVLMRAVGPSLAQFGVAPQAQQPRFEIFNRDGSVFDRGARVAVVYPDSHYMEIFRRAGAFPLLLPLTREVATRSFDVVTLPPGIYTVHAWDEAGAGGEVLVEIYEMPLQPAQ